MADRPKRPTCEHGDINIDNCRLCHERDNKIDKVIKPLADLFWSEKGRNAGDLNHLLYRAYRAGRRNEHEAL